MLTVLDLRDSPWVDGPGRTILETAVALREKGIKVIIGTFKGGKDSSPYIDRAIELGLSTVLVNDKSSIDAGSIKEIARIIKQYKVDVIHAHEFRSNLFGLIVSVITKTPVITTVHGWIINGFKDSVYTLLDKIFMRMFDKIITVSHKQARHLSSRFLIPNRKITTVHNTLRVDDYIINKNNSKFRDELGISKDVITIANIGRLSPEKGQVLFLKIAEKIIANYKNTCFILIGVGPDEELLRNMVIEYKLGQHVIFCGYREDMIDIYNSLDLVIQSSSTEGMPNVILESLLMEVPVIASDVGGTSEIVRNQHDGLLVKSDDLAGYVDAIESFLEHPEKLRKLASNGRLRILEDFNSTKRIESLKSIYSQLTDGVA